MDAGRLASVALAWPDSNSHGVPRLQSAHLPPGQDCGDWQHAAPCHVPLPSAQKSGRTCHPARRHARFDGVRLHTLIQRQSLPVAAETAWAFFSNPANLARLTPPGMKMRRPGGDQTFPVFAGQMLWFDIRLAPGIWRTWVTEITHVETGVAFIDEQRAGPCKIWRHRHQIAPLDDGACEVIDTVHYAMPFQPLGELAHRPIVRPMLEKLFAYRRQALAQIFSASQSPA